MQEICCHWQAILGNHSLIFVLWRKLPTAKQRKWNMERWRKQHESNRPAEQCECNMLGAMPHGLCSGLLFWCEVRILWGLDWDKVRNVPGGCPLQVRWIEDSHLADHGRDMLCSLNFSSSDWGVNKPREGVSVPASRGTTLCRDWICSLALLGSWVLHPFPQISLLNSDHPTIEQWIVTSIQVENLQQLIFGKNLEGLGPRFFLE